MKLPVERMRPMRSAFATFGEELRTMTEERKRFHLAGVLFAPLQKPRHLLISSTI